MSGSGVQWKTWGLGLWECRALTLDAYHGKNKGAVDFALSHCGSISLQELQYSLKIPPVNLTSSRIYEAECMLE